jgi:hypothetical protein
MRRSIKNEECGASPPGQDGETARRAATQELNPNSRVMREQPAGQGAQSARRRTTRKPTNEKCGAPQDQGRWGTRRAADSHQMNIILMDNRQAERSSLELLRQEATRR